MRELRKFSVGDIIIVDLNSNIHSMFIDENGIGPFIVEHVYDYGAVDVEENDTCWANCHVIHADNETVQKAKILQELNS